MTLPPLLPLALFMLAILALATYALAASGHFPATGRLPALGGAGGSAVIWGTVVVALLALLLAIAFAARTLPWPAAIIGGGISVLMAPVALNCFPDSVVDGRSGLIGFSAVALLVAGVASRLPF